MDEHVLAQCEPWPLDPTCLPDDWPEDEEAAEILIRKATLVARAYSAWTVGRCRYTVRPCRPDQTDPCAGPCGCEPVCRVSLGSRGDIECVERITIDGEQIPRSGWRLYNGRVVVLTGGRCFPACQRLDLELDEPGTWAIRYVAGSRPGPLASAAMTAIAVAMAQDCARTCATPLRNLTGLSVDGASYQFDGSARGSYRGLPEVEAWLDVVNPYRSMRQSAFIVPGERPVYIDNGQADYA